MRPLTPKQQRFVEEYLIDLNATQAAIRAGYSAKTASVIAAENLAKPNVAAAVQAAMAARSKDTGINAAWVVKKLVENIERAMQAIPVLDKEGNPTGEYRYEGAVVNGACSLLGKHFGMFVEKVEHSGPDGKPIEVKDGTPAGVVGQVHILAAALLSAASREQGGTPAANGLPKSVRA